MGLMDFINASKIKEENIKLKETNAQLVRKLDSLGFTEYEQTKAKIDEMNGEISSSNAVIVKLREEIQDLREKDEKLAKSIATQERKLKSYIRA